MENINQRNEDPSQEVFCASRDLPGLLGPLVYVLHCTASTASFVLDMSSTVVFAGLTNT